MSGTIKQLTTKDFSNKTDKGISVFDFFSKDCGPCRMILPILEKTSQEMEGKARFYKVDVEQDRALAIQFRVQSLPAIFVMKDGVVKSQFVGMTDRLKIIKAIKEA